MVRVLADKCKKGPGPADTVKRNFNIPPSRDQFLKERIRSQEEIAQEEQVNIEQIMTGSIVTIAMDEPLLFAKEIFERTGFHHLLVVENGKLFGVLSDRDLLRAISPNIGTASETEKDLATLNKRAHQVMSRKPITLRKSNHINEAISVFNQHKVSCIPVVEEGGIPVGIVSWRDILRNLKLG